MKRVTLLPSTQPISEKKPRSSMPGNCHFNTNWLRNPQYAAWLMPCELDEYKAACRVCCRSFEIASMGEAGVKSHMSGKKHTKLIEDFCARNGMESLFTMALTSEGVTDSPSTSGPLGSSSGHQNTVTSPFISQQLKSYYNAPYLQHSYRMRKALTGLDKLLLNWYTCQRNTSLPMTGAMLLEKARELAGDCQFDASLLNDSWIKRFKKRHGITFRATCGVGNGNHMSSDVGANDSGQSYDMLDSDMNVKDEPVSSDGPGSPGNPPSINDEDSCEPPSGNSGPSMIKNSPPQLPQSFPGPLMPPMLEFFREPSNKKHDSTTNEILRMQRDEHRLQMLVLRQKKVHKHQEHEAKMAEHTASMSVFALQREYWARMLQSIGGVPPQEPGSEPGPVPVSAPQPVPVSVPVPWPSSRDQTNDNETDDNEDNEGILP